MVRHGRTVVLGWVLINLLWAADILASTAKPPHPPAPPPEVRGYPAGVATLRTTRPFHLLLVDKSEQKVYLFQYQAGGEARFVQSFPCSTGKSEGDKIREGDRRTPEGIYFFTKYYRDNRLTIFGTTAFHMNYPNPFDQLENRQGNGIYLHGTNRPLGERATNGCVVMNNADLDFVAGHIHLYETPIIVSQRINWSDQAGLEHLRREFRDFQKDNLKDLTQVAGDVPAVRKEAADQGAVLIRDGERAVIRTPRHAGGRFLGWQTAYVKGYPHEAKVLARLWQPVEGAEAVAAARPKPRPDARREVLGFLQDWVKAWESRDVDKYIAFYSRRFRAYGMDYQAWHNYKAGLTNKYEAIDVQISEIKIQLKGHRAEVSFHQVYVSDKFQDIGSKKLQLVREGRGWKIFRETWRPDKTRADSRRAGGRS